jgi:hypothetical protein
MERIERDLSEIQTLRSTLQDDREYSSRLRHSLQDETVRMRELQSRILSQVILNPPTALTGLVRKRDGQAPATESANIAFVDPDEAPVVPGRAPEIILPANRGNRTADASHATPVKTRPGPAASEATAGAAASDATTGAGGRTPKTGRQDATASKSDEDFDFTFIQK